MRTLKDIEKEHCDDFVGKYVMKKDLKK